ncbi:MAG: 3-phosphoshikimate 1-carboxyvinyltransferase, partial [Acidimicrobiia bacterium]|nr:3-phosphoshikimate 1-carboxyvinyltransferase [Acidimicrobiia bacterium]
MERFPIDVTMVPVGPVRGTIRPPGSKSITNRAFLVAALADGESRLEGWLDADDTQAMRTALSALGAELAPEGSTMVVRGRSGRLSAPEEAVDVRSSGTTARFITAAAALADGPVRVDGSAQLRRRPIEPLVVALRSAGVGVDYLVATGALPICVHPAPLPGGHLAIDASVSSQFASGLMLVSPFAERDTEIDFVDGVAVSRTYLETTAEVMRAFGASVSVDESVSVGSGRQYVGRHYEIEADASAATYPLVAGAITGGVVTVIGIPAASTQADLGVLDVLSAMGCTVDRRPTSITLSAPSDGKLQPVDVDLSLAPDGALSIAVACLFASGPSTLRGLSTLRFKETDRLTALATELGKLGADTTVTDDTIVVVPGAPSGARITTYDDHRMAMAFSLAG